MKNENDLRLQTNGIENLFNVLLIRVFKRYLRPHSCLIININFNDILISPCKIFVPQNFLFWYFTRFLGFLIARMTLREYETSRLKNRVTDQNKSFKDNKSNSAVNFNIKINIKRSNCHKHFLKTRVRKMQNSFQLLSSSLKLARKNLAHPVYHYRININKFGKVF